MIDPAVGEYLLVLGVFPTVEDVGQRFDELRDVLNHEVGVDAVLPGIKLQCVRVFRTVHSALSSAPSPWLRWSPSVALRLTSIPYGDRLSVTHRHHPAERAEQRSLAPARGRTFASTHSGHFGQASSQGRAHIQADGHDDASSHGNTVRRWACGPSRGRNSGRPGCSKYRLLGGQTALE